MSMNDRWRKPYAVEVLLGVIALFALALEALIPNAPHPGLISIASLCVGAIAGFSTRETGDDE